MRAVIQAVGPILLVGLAILGWSLAAILWHESDRVKGLRCRLGFHHWVQEQWFTQHLGRTVMHCSRCGRVAS